MTYANASPLIAAALVAAHFSLMAAPHESLSPKPDPMSETTPSTVVRSYEGILKTGMMAIGGETTGIILTTATEGTFELALQSPELKAAAEKLNGKKVIVEGLYKPRKGVEIKQRRIIEVHSLAAAP